MAKQEQKIFFKPDDGLDIVIQRLKKSKAHRVELHIPEDSILKSSLDNFYAIKRESNLVKKEVVVESIDPHIEELASLAKLSTMNPIFGKNERLISDIIPKSHKHVLRTETAAQTEEESPLFTKEIPRKPKKKTPRHLKSGKRFVVILSVVAVIVLGIITAIYILPRAMVVVVLEKTTLEFNESVEAKSSVYETVTEDKGITLPGELLSAMRNIEMQFPANDEQVIEKKAIGELLVYNEFSSASQVLVERTRFLSPDGKIYRLNKRITVPGATVVAGKITPSYIKVSVTADKPGDEYNIDPNMAVSWRIPGFQEAGLTERYEGFYAKPTGPMVGGYIGSAFVPTEEDISAARQTVVSSLRSSLLSQMLVAESPNLRLLDEAEQFEIVGEEITEGISEDGTFQFFAEAEMKRMVFEEDTLVKALMERFASPLDYDVRIVESDLRYDDIKVDWQTNTLSFTAKGSFVVEPSVNKDNLKAQLFNQDESMIKSIIFSIPGLEKASISLWPFWVKRVPENLKRVKIELQ